MIGNPLIAKELISVLRSRAAAALAIGFIAALGLLAFTLWPQAGVNPAGGAQSRLFFSVLLAAQLVMLALFSPPFAATAITHERETNTWEMLYYSRLRPDEILLGKWAGASAFLLILVGLSLPVGGACFLLGGVTVREMFMAYLVLLAAGATFGLVGLAFSAVSKSSYFSLIATYIALLVLCGGVHLPMLLLPEWRGGQMMMHALRSASPFTALAAITRDSYRMLPGGSTATVTRFFLISGALATGLIVLLLVRIMRRPEPRVAKRKEVVDEHTPLVVRIARRIFFVIDPRRRRRSIGPLMNPIFILDLRTRTAGVGNILRAAFACLIVAIGLVILVSGTWGATRPDTIRLIALSFQIGLIALIGPSLTIGALASEIEGRTFDLLRMTPMSAWTLFSGKFMAAALPALLLVVASVPVFLALQVIQAVNESNIMSALMATPKALAALFAITGVTIAFALAAGLFFSSVCRTTARAGAWAYGLVSLATVGTLVGLVAREHLGAGLTRALMAFNPIVTAVGAGSETVFAEYGRWQDNVLALGSLSVVLTLATVYRLRRMAAPQE